jgi:peptidoglycan/LPS O-acetylase OafA/YrhL
MVRRRRKNRDHRHQNLNWRSGRGVEITVVTVLALGILFAVLYYLLSHDPMQRGSEESRLGPRTSPAHRAVISPRAAGPS